MIRYNDKFNYLKGDSIIKRGAEKIKYLSLGNHQTISLGGEIREQLQYFHNPNFGDLPKLSSNGDVGQLWHRAMTHLSYESGENFRIFAQLSSTFRFFNPNQAAPEIEENHLSLHQLFGQYYFNSKWMLRIGRQELSYGNHRLFTFREGPNTRLAFDAALIRHQSEKRTIDFIALSPVVAQKGIFDDEKFKDIIAGVYATEKLVPGQLSVDYYFLNFESGRRKYNYTIGHDSRRIFGSRLFSEAPFFNYELEATYQTGKFNQQKINAYSLSADFNFALSDKGRFIIGTAANYVTGDRSKEDAQLNTYNSLFSKPQYGLTAPIGATNIITVNPYLKAIPVKRAGLYAGAYFLWRQSSHDGCYTPTGIEQRPNPDRLDIVTEKKIGALLSLETNYALNKHLSFAIDASRFFASAFINQTGNGKDINYLSFKAAYKF